MGNITGEYLTVRVPGRDVMIAAALKRFHSASILRKTSRRKVTSVLITATLAIVFLLFVLNSSTYEQAPDGVRQAPDGVRQAPDGVMEYPESPGGLRFSKSGAVHIMLFPMMLLCASIVTRLFVMALCRNPSRFIRML